MTDISFVCNLYHWLIINVVSISPGNGGFLSCKLDVKHYEREQCANNDQSAARFACDFHFNFTWGSGITFYGFESVTTE
jgi:hypothetical protein